MKIVYSQKYGEEIMSRAKFRKIIKPILATFSNSPVLTKIFFYKPERLTGCRGNFRHIHEHGFFVSERKWVYKKGVRGIITLKLGRATSDRHIFGIFAHEFYHWRQSQKVNFKGAKYSEKKTRKWERKMTEKYYGKLS